MSEQTPTPDDDTPDPVYDAPDPDAEPVDDAASQPRGDDPAADERGIEDDTSDEPEVPEEDT